MCDRQLHPNPDAVPGAPVPRSGYHRVNGATIYAEVRGTGPAILLIPGGAEDAEGWRPVAERLIGHSVVTYDRRGTMRSSREDWPGLGSAQHADDAAGLLVALGMRGVVVFGGSSAGIVAVQLALRHPTLVRRALVYEPGYFRSTRDQEGIQARVSAATEAHLDTHPGDWAGAYRAFARAATPDPASGPHGLLTPPEGKEWHAQREEINAEAFVRDDVPFLTAESVDESALASCPVDVCFSSGSETMAVFRDIAVHLAAVRGAAPDVIDGVGHAIYLDPEQAATYIDGHSAP
jgi:pimeloyl-ACP methyl ester carboxylesterase